MYYVYAYLNPLKPINESYSDYQFDYEPFYIGMSKLKNRFKHHLRDAKNGKLRNKVKESIIRNILNSNSTPIIIKIEENLTQEQACVIERNLIEKIGRIIESTGPLSNVLSGGQIINNELISIRLRENKNLNKHLRRKVLMYDLGNKLLKTFESVKSAKQETGISHIGQCCMGDRKHAGGYIWKYDKVYKKRKFTKHHKNITNRKKVLQYNSNMKFIRIYNSISEFDNTEFNYRMVRKSCRELKLYKNNYFRYENK